MTDDTTNRPPGAEQPTPPSKDAVKTVPPRKGFDVANLKGGNQPGGKMVRGTRSMQSAKSRGRG